MTYSSHWGDNGQYLPIDALPGKGVPQIFVCTLDLSPVVILGNEAGFL